MSTIQLKRSSVAGNVPASLQPGEPAINQASGFLFWADSAGVVHKTPLFGAPSEAIAGNNLAVNAAMEISQFNGSSQLTLVNGNSPLYVVDQWTVAYSNTGGAFTAAQVAPYGTTIPFGLQLPKCLQLKATSAVGSYAANDFAVIRTPIEGYRWGRLGYGTTGGRNVTVAFWCYTDEPGTGTVSIQNQANNRSCPVSFTLAAGWNWCSVVIPPDTAGTWLNDNTIGAWVSFCFGCGGNLQGTEGAWTSTLSYGSSLTTNMFTGNGNTVAITGVLIIPGAYEIGQAHGALACLPFDKELANCQRYWRKSYDYVTRPGATVNFNGVAAFNLTGLSSATYGGGHDERFSCSMRTAPTLIGYSPQTGSSGKAYDNINAADVAVTFRNAGENGFRWNATNSTVAASVDLLLHWIADARM